LAHTGTYLQKSFAAAISQAYTSSAIHVTVKTNARAG
jgi:hypothetical protein